MAQALTMAQTNAMRAAGTVQRGAATNGGIRQIKSKPGLLFDPDRKVYFKIMDTTVHAQYDTSRFTSSTGVISYGTKVNFAQDISGKELIDTNFTQPRRLTAGQILWVSRIGLYLPPVFGNTRIDYLDQQVIVENGFFLLKVNGKELLKGPGAFFPSGFGWQGSTTKNNDGVVTLGLASLNGVPPLAKKQYLNEFYDVDASLTVQPHDWIGTATVGTPELRNGTNAAVPNAFLPVKFVMHGRLYSPSTV